jgi:hypothetical protein
VGSLTIAPGVYYDLPEADYRAQTDWLSVSGAKKLLKPSCPAKFKAALDGGEEHRPQFDVGRAFHAVVLGAGDAVVVIDADSYRSADARLMRDEAYATHRTPLLAAEHEVVEAMAAAVKAHPIAAALFARGRPEVSLFWVDEATGVKCKARLDWLPDKVEGRRLIVPDLKSAASAEPDEFARNAARFGYLSQDRWYCDGIRATDLDPDPAFVFVVVEKDPPHVVTVGQFAGKDDLGLATVMNDKARRLYRECVESDTWPGYAEGVADLYLPTWFHYQMENIA